MLRTAFLIVISGALAFADLSLSPNTANASAGGAANSVQVISTDQSTKWTVRSDQSWLTITSGAAGTGNGNFSYAASGNPAATNRIATVTVTPSSGTAPTLVITQLGGILSISPSSANAAVGGDAGTVSVYTEDPFLQWTATSNAGWVTVTAGGSGIGSANVQWSAAANTGNNRTAIITVTPLGGVGQTFPISQQQGSPAPSITVSPSSITPDAAGGSGMIQVTASLPSITWSTTTTNGDLVKLSGGSGTGNGTISYTITPNPSATTRTATITVTPGQGAQPVSISVTQSGGILSITPNATNLPAGGGSGTITLSTNDSALKWTASSSQTWVTITSGAQGAGPGSVQWTGAANTTNSSRSATISVVPLNGTPLTFSINQAPAVITGTITLTPGSGTAPASISNGTVQVTTSDQGLSWTAVPSDSWVTITSGASGTGNGSIQYRATGNTMGANRTATIAVTPSNGTGAVFTLTQIASVLTITPSSATVPAPGGTGSFAIATNNSTLLWSAASSDSWLSITSAISGVGDATMTWAASSNTNVTARTATISVTPLNGQALIFTVSQAALSGTINTTPNALTFAYQQLGTVPAAAQVAVTDGGGFLPIAASANGGTWLSVSANSGTTPVVLTVSVNPSGLAAGTYNGTVSIASAAATNSPVNIPVTFTVTPAAVLTSAPNGLNFSYQQSGPTPSSKTLAIGASGGASIDYTFVADTTAPWLSASGAGPAPSTVTVNVNPTGLPPGNYQGMVTLIAPAAGNSPFQVPVSLMVSAAPTLSASPSSLTVTYRQLDPLPSPIDVVVNSSGGALAFEVDISSSTPWLTLNTINRVPTTGTTPTTVTLAVNPTGLAPGTYQGAVVLTSVGAGNNPLTVPVTLTVSAGATLSATPSQVSLGWTQNVSVSATQTIAVSSDSPVGFTAGTATLSGGSWLTATVSSGQTPSVVALSASGAGLSPGIYQGTVTLTSGQAANSPLVIPVTFTVSAQPQLQVTPGVLNFSYQLLSGPPPERDLIVSAGNLNVGVSASASSTGNWLSVSGGTTTPGAIQVTADATGLVPGNYSGTVTLTSPGFASATVNVSFRVSAAPVLNVHPASIELTYQQGSVGLPPQTVAVSSSSTAFPFNASVGPGASWLSVAGGGTTPGSISISANPTGLSPGSYSGTVVLTGSQAGNSPMLIPVHLLVTAQITVAALPSSMNFTYTQQGLTPAVQALSISSSQTQNFSVAISSAESWLIVSGEGPTPSGLEVSIDPNGLRPGSYSASIIINAPNAANTPLVVPVSLTVNAAPSITPSQGQYTFSYQMGGLPPANETLTVTSTEPSLVVTATASTSSGGNWLSIIGGGNIPAQFSIIANPSGLPPGIYQGTVTLSSTGAGNSPLNIPMTLVVAAAPVIAVTPPQLSFSYAIGSANPPIGTSVQVTSSGSALTYQVSATTDNGGPWLLATSGATTPGTTTVSVIPLGLAPGTYTGTVSFTSDAAGNSPLILPVTLTVSTTTLLTSAPASVQFLAQQGGASPSPQTVHIDAGGLPIVVTYQSSPGSDWLTFAHTGITPTDLTITASPTGLPPGRYTALILAMSSFAANNPLQIPVALDVNATPVLSAFPSILQYTYTISGPKPEAQGFSVVSSGGPLAFNVGGAPLPPWLFATGSGTTPGTVSVTVDPGILTAGVYQSTVQVSSPDSPSPVSVQVILTVSNVPVLAAIPSSLTFAYQIGGPIPVSGSVVATSDVGSQTTIASATTTTGGNWLIVNGGGDTPAVASVSVNPVGLAAGVYQGRVSFTAIGVASSPLIVPVTLSVSSAPTLNTSAIGATFAYQLGGSAPPDQQITLTSSDGSTLPVAQTVSGSGFFSAILNTNTTPAVLTVSALSNGLSAGVYQGSIVVSSATAGNSPVVLPVVLTISAAPSITAGPGTAVFAYTIGGAAPLPALINLGSTGVPLNFSMSTAGASSWLIVSGSGTTPAARQISVDGAGLAPGIYKDTVVISAPGSGNNPLLIPVTLVVSGSSLLLAAPSSLTFSVVSATRVRASSLSIGSTGPPLPFSSSVVSSGSWLSAAGSGTTPNSVLVSVDATALVPGTYQGAVLINSPGAPNSPLIVPVTLVVTQAASLSATPAPVTFSYKQAGAPLLPQTVNVTLGDQPATNAHATAAPGAPWLTLQNGSGSSIVVNANPAGLLPGTYNGIVQVVTDGAPNSPLTIPVTLVVTGLTEFDISQDSFALTALAANSQPVSNTVSITTGQNPPVNFSLDVTASTWLAVTPTSGTTPTTLTVTADPTGLRPGSYSGSIIVSSNGNRLRTMPVNLVIASTPSLTSSPPFLVFNYSHGGNAPSPVNLYIGRFGADISVIPTPSDPWITVNPSTASASGPITVTIQPSGLAVGTYKGSITLTVANGGGSTPLSRQIPVTLYVDEPANPQIDSVLSGMSFLNTPLTAGMIFSVFGENIGPTVPLNFSIQADQTINLSLGGVEVLVNGIPCPLIYVSSTQINAIAPYALYTKNAAHVAVRYLGVLSDEVPVIVAPSAPGLFSYPSIGSGPGAILNQDLSVNTKANPAAKGSMITLFGGGDGQSAPQGIDGLVNPVQLGQLPHPLLPVTVTIGGVTATEVQYAGAAPTLVSGVIQVNVRIPAGVATGDLPVVIQVGGTSSQSGLTVSVK